MPDTEGYKHTLTICNTHFSFATTTVSWTRPNVALYVHCLSCRAPRYSDISSPIYFSWMHCASPCIDDKTESVIRQTTYSVHVIPFLAKIFFWVLFFARLFDLCSYLSVRHYSAQMVTLLSYTPLVCCTVGVIMVIILAAISISQVFSCVDFTIKLTYKVQLFLDSQSISEERYINQISK